MQEETLVSVTFHGICRGLLRCSALGLIVTRIVRLPFKADHDAG